MDCFVGLVWKMLKLFQHPWCKPFVMPYLPKLIRQLWTWRSTSRWSDLFCTLHFALNQTYWHRYSFLLVSKILQTRIVIRLPSVLFASCKVLEECLWNKKPETCILKPYMDSDYAGDTNDGKSMSGYLIKLGNTTCIWSSKKATDGSIINLQSLISRYDNGIKRGYMDKTFFARSWNESQ